MKQLFKDFVIISISAIILMFFALYDGFPIVTGDTGSYITSGFTLKVPSDRPVFYGLFIRLTSLGASLWMTMFVQCAMLSYVLLKFSRKFDQRLPDTHFIGLVIFISFLTMGGWFASQLMPDIFVPIMILCIVNFLVFTNSQTERIILLIIIFLCTLFHNSNFLLLTLFSITFLLITFLWKNIPLQRVYILTLTAVSLISWTTLCTSNYISGNGFVSSRSAHVFIMGKLVESGVLKTYLDKACPIRNYKICNYKDDLPPVAWQFHWDALSPLQKEGGWEANRSEYNTIINDIFSRPKYYPYLAFKAVDATARQLVLYNIDGSYILPWIRFDEESSPYKAVKEYFPHEINELKVSRMNQKTLNIPFYDNTFNIILIVSILFLLFSRPYFKSPQLDYILILIIVLIILNAFVTAVLSSVNARFNSRVIWIIPFLSFLQFISTIFPSILKKSES